MNTKTLKSEFLLLLTAAIWGFAFVAQRAGMAYIGPFIFNAVRFALGGLVLIPVILYLRHRRIDESATHLAYAGTVTGVVLFIAVSLQQIGIVYTTAGKAGFITGLYVVLVPVLGIFLRQRPGPALIIGVFLAVAGMYFLCIDEKMSIAKGDMIVLVSTFFWAVHVQIIDYFSDKTIGERLAFEQFMVCSALSFLTSWVTETTTLSHLIDASIPVLYGGILSCGIAYTLQIIGQKHVAPTPATILMSTECVFAAIGGSLFLSESLKERAIWGCGLLFFGMIISQLQAAKRQSSG